MQKIDSDIYPIIGMSPGNSYFKDDEIKYLLKKNVEKYGRVAVMIADIPAISTYMAFGYPENRARRDKALPQGNLLRNRTERAMVQLGYSNSQVKIIDWEHEVEGNNNYKKWYDAVQHLYEINEKFKNDANETTKAVLVGSKREIKDIETAVGIAVHYLLSEIAFLDWAPEFLGTEKVVYAYHKNWLIYENYIAGKYDGIPKTKTDFVLLENPWETFNPVWGLEDAEFGGESKTSLERVEKTKILRVAFSNYPPALIYDKEHDVFSGIFYEIVCTIAKKNGWEIKCNEETGYGVIIDGLENNRFDIFGSTVWPTPERKEAASFSASLYKSPVFSWVREDYKKTDQEIREDIHCRIVIKENDISHSIATADYNKGRFVYTPQLSEPVELLEFVATDRGDVTFVEPFLAEYFNTTSVVKLIPASTKPIRIYENTFMFKKSDTSLRDLFNIEIKGMQESGFIAELIKKYTGSADTFDTN